MVHEKLLTKKVVDKKNLLTKKIVDKKKLLKKYLVKIHKTFFPKTRRRSKFSTYVFPKIGRWSKFTKCVFPKISRTRFPKSVHGLPDREKLSVFVYTSFFRECHHVKFGYTRRRKCRVLTKCQNFSGDLIFLQSTFCVQVHFSGCVNCGNTHFCPTQKICAKS